MPSRLTLGVAAATVAVATVGGVSAGVSLGATPAAGPASQAAGHAGLSVAGPGSPLAASRQFPAGKAMSAKAKATAGKQASGKAGSGKTAQPRVPASGARRSAAPHRQAPVRRAAPASSAKPYRFYDADATGTPDVPAGYEIATYANGPHPTPPSEVAGRSHVLWIDINGSDPAAQIIDVEPGAAEPSQVAGWVDSRLTAQPHALAIVYTMISDWGQIQSDVAALPSWMQARVRWWIADPTGQPHIVPGSQATQWYWGPNYDISTAEPGF